MIMIINVNCNYNQDLLLIKCLGALILMIDDCPSYILVKLRHLAFGNLISVIKTNTARVSDFKTILMNPSFRPISFLFILISLLLISQFRCLCEHKSSTSSIVLMLENTINLCLEFRTRCVIVGFNSYLVVRRSLSNFSSLFLLDFVLYIICKIL